MLEEPINKLLPQESAAEAESKASLAEPAKAILLPLFYTVGLALALRLFYNFCGGHPNAFAAADASEYLRYTDALARILAGQASAPLAVTLKEFVITGPSLPVFLLLANMLTGQPFDPSASATPLAAQSFISALTAGLIYLIAHRLFDARTALYAGLTAAVYPAFIVNSGRLYSETFATFAECLAVLLLVRVFFLQDKKSIKSIVNNFILGAVLVILQLSRSAMVLLTFASLAIVFLQGFFPAWGQGAGRQKDFGRALISLGYVLIGAGAILAPWFVFERAAFNKISLAVDRVGHYNLFVGTDSKIQGFLSYPYPDGRGIEQKSFPTLIKEAYRQSPSRFLKLMLDKPARLLKSPWNDFRAAIGPVDFKLQTAVHQLILLLSVIGIALGLFCNYQTDDDEKKKICGRLLLLLVFSLNLPYLAFITVPRYNLTAMPFLIIFAAAGLHTLMTLLQSDKLARAPKVAAILGLCLFLYLRDDLKDAFVFGQEPTANFFFVQSHELLSRGLISLAFGLGFLASIYLSIGLLQGQKTLARTVTVLIAALTLPLLALPQRANGRAGEGIISLERRDENLVGAIPLPADAFKDIHSNAGEWYLLVDCQDGQIFSHDLELTVNGQKLTGPVLPAIAALDDWNYLKESAGGRAYLECSYIFDCMTQPASMSNLDVRQWFYLPLSRTQVEEAARRGRLDVSLLHKTDQSTRLFSAALNKDSALIPGRDSYSWEKAFYGVENDSGLTDSRYDEKVPLRQAKWKLNYKGKSEELSGFDLNVRLLQVRGAGPSEENQITASGAEPSLELPDALVKKGKPVLLRATLKPDTAKASPISEAAPRLYLDWTDESGKKITMPLPWLKKSNYPLDILVLCDLNRVKGTGLKAHIAGTAPYKDVSLALKTIEGHPIFGDCKLY